MPNPAKSAFKLPKPSTPRLKSAAQYPEQECLQAARHAAAALGRAHSERAYEDCMVNYFYRKRMPYLRQRNFYQNVHGEIIHVGVADLEVDHRIVLELKANVKDISEDHKAQLMRYLRAANQDARRGYVLCDFCLAPFMHFRYCMAQCQDPYYLFKFSMFLRFSTRRKSFLIKI